MKTKSLLIKLSKRFPKKIAKQYHDYVGLMAGKLPEEVNKVVVCLDLDEQIIDEVIKLNPDIIFTHHPFIYGSKSKVLKYDLKKAELVELIEKHDLCVYSMHTNFDTGIGGMNDALAKKLLLNDIYSPLKDPMMRIGSLKEEMNVETFAKYAKELLNVDYALLINNGSSLIRKVAIVGGGGSRGWPIAKEEGADIFISGDAPHHVRRDIITSNFNYLDVPHEVERIFMPTLKNILNNIDRDLEIITIDHEKMPKVVI